VISDRKYKDTPEIYSSKVLMQLWTEKYDIKLKNSRMCPEMHQPMSIDLAKDFPIDPWARFIPKCLGWPENQQKNGSSY